MRRGMLGVCSLALAVACAPEIDVPVTDGVGLGGYTAPKKKPVDYPTCVKPINQDLTACENKCVKDHPKDPERHGRGVPFPGITRGHGPQQKPRDGPGKRKEKISCHFLLC